MVRYCDPRPSTTPERMRAAPAPAPIPAPRTDPATPVRAAVRRTAPMTWRREAPTQRSRPVVRVWRATRVAKVVAMTMAATTAHTGPSTPSRSSVAEVLLPLFAARMVTMSSAV